MLDDMTLDVAKINALVETELASISQSELIDKVRSLRVTPRCELRPWDYGAPGENHPCWIVVEHPQSRTGIAYCENGFGPKYPWGLVFISGDHLNMGMDSQWYLSLEAVVRDSMFWEGENPEKYDVE